MTVRSEMAKPPRAMYTDAAALGLSSAVTAVLGLAFWGLAARLVPPARLGVQTALIAIVSAPAMVVAAGVGDACNAIVPVAGARRDEVVARAYRIVALWSLVVGVLAAATAVVVLEEVEHRVLVAGLVTGGVVAWALYVVQDPLLTSLRRAYWLPVENGAASLVKLGLVVPLVALDVAEPLVVASLAACALAVVVVYPQVRRLARNTDVASTQQATDDGPDELEALARRTTPPVAFMLGMFLLTPFLVTAVAGPTEGAVYSLALSIVSGLDYVGVALSVAFVVHATGASGNVGAMARVAFIRLFTVVALGAIALAFVAPQVLTMLNPEYRDLHGARVIAVLAVGSVLRTGYLIWSAVQRARRQMRVVTGLNAAATVLVLALLPPLAHRWGATGGAVALVAAQILLSAGAGVHVVVARRRR